MDGLVSVSTNSSRECGTCTACCTVFAIVELNKPARWACDHVCREGCRAYDTRPASCRDFHCVWLRGELQVPTPVGSRGATEFARIQDGASDPAELLEVAPLGNVCSNDDDLRPDKLGVIFDRFLSLASGRERYIALELWKGAFDEPRAAQLLQTIATECEIELSYRDGTWRTIGTPGTVPQSA